VVLIREMNLINLIKLYFATATAGSVVAPGMSAGCRSGWATASGSPAHGVDSSSDSVRGNINTMDRTMRHSIDYLLFDAHLITST
jgi:hypothetical protein